MKKKLVVKGPIPRIKDCVINDFDEEYVLYLRNAKKNWRNPEGFSLDYDSMLSDLRESHFIYVDREDLEQSIKRQCNVIEEIEL